MIEIIALIWLCRINAEEANNRGRSRVLYVILTIVLWFGMETIGFMIGRLFGVWYIAYLLAIAFAALGGFIAHAVAGRSIAGDKPRSDYRPRGGSFVSNDYFTGANAIQINHAQITISRESGGLRSPDAWEFFLNGQNIGWIEDGMQVTVTTGHRTNVLVARNSNGALSPAFEFTVESGWLSQVIFSDGRFISAKKIGKAVFGSPAMQGAQR